MKNCAACTLWAKSEMFVAGWRMDMGTCANVPKFYEATEDVLKGDLAGSWNSMLPTI